MKKKVLSNGSVAYTLTKREFEHLKGNAILQQEYYIKDRTYGGDGCNWKLYMVDGDYLMSANDEDPFFLLQKKSDFDFLVDRMDFSSILHSKRLFTKDDADAFLQSIELRVDSFCIRNSLGKASLKMKDLENDVFTSRDNINYFLDQMAVLFYLKKNRYPRYELIAFSSLSYLLLMKDDNGSSYSPFDSLCKLYEMKYLQGSKQE